MDDEPAEPEDEPCPDSDKPRFLLPDGCKDLIDVLALRTRAAAPAPHSSRPLPKSNPAHSAKGCPGMVILSDPIPVRELAAVLHLQPFQVIGSLMQLDVFASVNGAVQFDTAWELCARYGVLAVKAV